MSSTRKRLAPSDDGACTPRTALCGVCAGHGEWWHDACNGLGCRACAGTGTYRCDNCEGTGDADTRRAWW